METIVLATLAYAHATDTPLTAMQVWRRMIQPERLQQHVRPTLPDVFQELERLVASGQVIAKDGYYLPTGADEQFFKDRLIQADISAEKWRLMLDKAWWLQMAPFVRALAASGSMATGTTDDESDWDMFVIARSNRLYTARLGLLIVAQFMGRLRVKEHRTASNLFCFNHYIADDGLRIRHRSLFVAQAMTQLVPVYNPDGYIERLWRNNAWLADFMDNPPYRQAHLRRTVTSSRFLGAVRRIVELLIDATLGNVLEGALRWWQQRRIARVPDTYASGGRVVADEQEIEFHPRSAERAVLTRYNASLMALGRSGQEPDSGLTL